MYTRMEFGRALKEKVVNKENIANIGHWAYVIYYDHIEDIDLDFVDVLLTLNHMEEGPEFELSYERLNEIADDLIAGKRNINMDY